MADEEIRVVGSSIFKKIESDDRVTPELRHCLYCRVSQSGSDVRGEMVGHWHKDIPYEIPLDNIQKGIKQCPACKTIYILGDPLQNGRDVETSRQ